MLQICLYDYFNYSQNSLFIEDEFRCSYYNCYWDVYTEGNDYEKYNTSSDCMSCKKLCANTTKCGGVECDNGFCVLWKVGRCGTRETQIAKIENANTKTCMKYDEGNVKTF